MLPLQKFFFSLKPYRNQQYFGTMHSNGQKCVGWCQKYGDKNVQHCAKKWGIMPKMCIIQKNMWHGAEMCGMVPKMCGMVSKVCFLVPKMCGMLPKMCCPTLPILHSHNPPILNLIEYYKTLESRTDKQGGWTSPSPPSNQELWYLDRVPSSWDAVKLLLSKFCYFRRLIFN